MTEVTDSTMASVLGSVCIIACVEIVIIYFQIGGTRFYGTSPKVEGKSDKDENFDQCTQEYPRS